MPLRQGQCGRGWQPIEERDGGRWCVASSACAWDGERSGPGPQSNQRCFPGDLPADLRQAGEDSCRPFPFGAQAGLDSGTFAVLRGALCEPGYFSADPDAQARGCYDAYGRRVKSDGSAWREIRPDGYAWSGWYHGICPPQAMTSCSTGPSPSPSAPAPAECFAGPWRMHCRYESCDIPGEPRDPVHGDAVDAAVAAVAPRWPIPVTDEDGYTADLARELRAAGYCAATHAQDPRISHDEVAVWPRTAGDPVAKEHWDCVLSSGDTRYPFMVARGIP
jgi:hypothetical protein